jgi:hypothetical protein
VVYITHDEQVSERASERAGGRADGHKKKKCFLRSRFRTHTCITKLEACWKRNSVARCRPNRNMHNFVLAWKKRWARKGAKIIMKKGCF